MIEFLKMRSPKWMFLILFTLARLFRSLINQRTSISFKYGKKSWIDAVRNSGTYDNEEFLSKLSESAKLVFGGEAIYERDGAIFENIEFSWPFLCSILYASPANRRMDIVDFGGGLGSSYFQNIGFLSKFIAIDSWKIIEQEKVVQIGKHDFCAINPTFHFSFSEIQNTSTHLIIFGSVLQYLESPFEVLKEAFSLQPNFILLDRTPFVPGTADYYGIQHVPQDFYSANYAIRVFSEVKFRNLLMSNSYEIIYEWVCELQPDPRSTCKGFLLRRIE